MTNKYKRALEIEWEGKSLADIKRRTLQIQTDRNLSDVLKRKYQRTRR